MKISPQGPGFARACQPTLGRSQTRDKVVGEAEEETPSGAGRGGVASTGLRGRSSPKTGAEAKVFSLTTLGGSAGGGGGEGEGGGGGGG